MINWIRNNAPLASLAGALAIAIATVAVDRYQLSGLVAKQPEIEKHMGDTTRHIDPNRDPNRLKRLEERIDKLEEQLDRANRMEFWRNRREQWGGDGQRRGNRDSR